MRKLLDSRTTRFADRVFLSASVPLRFKNNL